MNKLQECESNCVSGSDTEEEDEESEANSEGEDSENVEALEAPSEGDNIKNEETVTEEAKSQNEQKKKKIGPQKQKKALHTLLKKAKMYEIRKLIRRINRLKNLKGSEEQIAKNNRKVENLVKDVEAMRGFMNDVITERTVDVFKGTAEKLYMDIWNACMNTESVDKMLQTLSLSNDSEKREKIAYLRMLSSKDIVHKLQQIQRGININPRKNKVKSKKILWRDRKNAKNKFVRKENTKDVNAVMDVIEIANNEAVKDAIVNTNKTSDKHLKGSLKWKRLKESDNSKKVFDKDITEKQVIQESIDEDVVFDDFFLRNVENLPEDDGFDENFSTPVVKQQSAEGQKFVKKNRMGQRQRKQTLERKQGEKTDGNYRQSSKTGKCYKNNERTKYNKMNRDNRYGSNNPSKKYKPRSNENCVKPVEKVDRSLHPSWQAKQQLKAKQGITGFAGTKITFDD